MVERILQAPGQFWMLALMWIRSTLAYPASFALMMVTGILITITDFVAVLLMFSHITAFGGFSLAEMALLYATSSLTMGIADLIVGKVEQVGRRIRSGALDSYLVRPVPAIIQTAADEFRLDKLGRIAQAVTVLVIALVHIDVDWTVAKGIMLVVGTLAGALIFGSFFVLGAAFQFIAIDSAELANSFTYGGRTLTQYPLTAFGKDIVRAVTFVVPLAFVNFYPVLFVLGKQAPLGLPSWIGLLSPVAAAVMVALAALGWRGGLRRYRSTGS
ncbi:ABC transporter permease [Kribbella sp. NPDC051587]|uniref:ABC transporter permease n=1 Tax=Kribbella sp. NPDC051587 TaxID=3364119 RepID=UPI00379C0C7F